MPISAPAHEETEIAGFRALHDPRNPLGQMAAGERNAAWVKICRQVANALRPLAA